MPYVDLPNAHDDYASLWYITNSPTGTVGGFDPAKATVLLLHPLFLDSAWLTAQFEDPRLSGCYNLIALDARHAGQTTSRLNGKQDSWTDAADLAFALEALCLPAVHVWACELFATSCALRFAAIFPEKCLSLTLLTVPCDTNTSDLNLNEIVQLWCYAQELETVEHAFMNVVTTLCGHDVNVDLEDDLIAHLEVHYPPFRRTIVSHLGCLLACVERPSQELLSYITQPVLLIHGDSNESFSPEVAFRVQEQLINAKDGAKLYFIRGAQGYLGVVPESASIANRVFASFLARLPPARSDPQPPYPMPLDDALRRLGEIMHDPDISTRDPCSPMAFSCVPPALVRWRTQVYARAAAGHRGAFSPLDRSGRPTRRYSERLQEQWFEVDRNWFSHSAQSEESPTRKHTATYDERYEMISQKLAREFSIASAWRHIQTVAPEAIERMALSSSFSSRTAGWAAWAIQRLPI
ncbi:alpha/beta-hydrolase [Lactifluus subvellereus]|nr:alpha/beta-hydrolase [Lactifluus subvellereus]